MEMFSELGVCVYIYIYIWSSFIQNIFVIEHLLFSRYYSRCYRDISVNKNRQNTCPERACILVRGDDKHNFKSKFIQYVEDKCSLKYETGKRDKAGVEWGDAGDCDLK